eukprot:5573199-Pleurochrysis_carterae.AAC.1
MGAARAFVRGSTPACMRTGVRHMRACGCVRLSSCEHAQLCVRAIRGPECTHACAACARVRLRV